MDAGNPFENSHQLILRNSDKTFRLSDGLKTHQTGNSHSSDDKPYYICHKCRRLFSQPQSLKAHLRLHGEMKSDQCDICQKRFTDLKRHEMLCHGGGRPRPFKCDICDKGFPLQQTLIHHQKIHTELKPHRCGICPKKFSHSGDLYTHIRTHAVTKSSSWRQIPNKRVSGSGKFSRTHVIRDQRHEEPYTYKCVMCEKSFSQFGKLKGHLRDHTQEKPYPCIFCKLEYGSRHALKMHTKNSH